MKNGMTFKLLLTVGFIVPSAGWVAAQPDQPRAECDRLISVLKGKAPGGSYEALQKMQIYRQEGQYQACIDAERAVQSQTSLPAKLQAGQVAGMDVINEREEQVGDVDRLVRGADQEIYVLMTYRGPRWPGNKQVAVPLDNMMAHNDKLLLLGVGEKDILAMPAVPQDGGAYKPLAKGEVVSVQPVEAAPTETGAVKSKP